MFTDFLRLNASSPKGFASCGTLFRFQYRLWQRYFLPLSGASNKNETKGAHNFQTVRAWWCKTNKSSTVNRPQSLQRNGWNSAIPRCRCMEWPNGPLPRLAVLPGVTGEEKSPKVWKTPRGLWRSGDDIMTMVWDDVPMLWQSEPTQIFLGWSFSIIVEPPAYSWRVMMNQPRYLDVLEAKNLLPIFGSSINRLPGYPWDLRLQNVITSIQLT